MTVPQIKLADGHVIPQIGLGLWHVTDQNDFRTAFKAAIKAGYRMFDSAQYYRNEQFFGESIKNSKINRSEIFITSKIAYTNFGYNRTIDSFHESLKKLEVEYIDLMLLHFPVSILRKKSWQALEDLKEVGLVRSIGVSNYTIRHIEELKNYAKEMPVVNQVELHVFLQQPDLVDYCRKHNIAVEAYSPLAQASKMTEPLVLEIAEKYHKSYAQIMLRFLIQKDLIVIPKSVTPSRIEENMKIFDFNLDKADMSKLEQLDRGLHTAWNPTLVP